MVVDSRAAHCEKRRLVMKRGKKKDKNNNFAFYVGRFDERRFYWQVISKWQGFY